MTAKTRSARGQRRKPVSATGSSRSRLIGAIRAACHRRGIEDDDRRALQHRVTGKLSLADMSIAELSAMLDQLNRDWSGRPVSNERAHIGKMRALWWSLYWTGAIERPDDDALTSFVKRQTGIEHLRFLDHFKARSVIEALKSWLEREGVLWWSQDEIAGARGADFTAAHADRQAVIGLIGQRLEIHGVVPPGMFWPECDRFLNRVGASRWSMTTVELDAAIRHFGKALRRAIGPQP